VQVYLRCGDDCTRTVDVTRQFAGYATGTRQTVSIPLQCFVQPGADLTHVDVPFGIRASAPFSAAFANIRIAATGDRADAACPAADAP
jgi:beta-glucosidase